MRYEKRAAIATHQISKRLLSIMAEKKSNLCASADFTNTEDLLTFTDAVGEDICMLKTHVDIIEDFTPDFTKQLRTLADKHNFLIFEDRKFADIGNTVKLQCAGGIYRIAEWADIINAHSVAGPSIISGLAEACKGKDVGIVLLAEMTPVGNLTGGSYTEASIAMAEDHTDSVMGFISMKKLSNDPGMIHMTPGVHLEQSGDALGQQYQTPESVIDERNNDVIIVGRGIYKADDPAAAAKQYREASWAAYENREA